VKLDRDLVLADLADRLVDLDRLVVDLDLAHLTETLGDLLRVDGAVERAVVLRLGDDLDVRRLDGLEHALGGRLALGLLLRVLDLLHLDLAAVVRVTAPRAAAA